MVMKLQARGSAVDDAKSNQNILKYVLAILCFRFYRKYNGFVFSTSIDGVIVAEEGRGQGVRCGPLPAPGLWSFLFLNFQMKNNLLFLIKYFVLSDD